MNEEEIEGILTSLEKYGADIDELANKLTAHQDSLENIPAKTQNVMIVEALRLCSDVAKQSRLLCGAVLKK